MSARSSISSSADSPIPLSTRGRRWVNCSMRGLWVLRSVESWSRSWLANYRFASSRRLGIEGTITCLQPPTSLPLPPSFQYSSQAALCQFGTCHDMQLDRPGEPSQAAGIYVDAQQTQVFSELGLAVPSKKGQIRWPVILLCLGQKRLPCAEDRTIQAKKPRNGRLLDPFFHPLRKNDESLPIPAEILLPASVNRSECQFLTPSEDEKTMAAMILSKSYIMSKEETQT